MGAEISECTNGNKPGFVTFQGLWLPWKRNNGVLIWKVSNHWRSSTKGLKFIRSSNVGMCSVFVIKKHQLNTFAESIVISSNWSKQEIPNDQFPLFEYEIYELLMISSWCSEVHYWINKTLMFLRKFCSRYISNFCRIFESQLNRPILAVKKFLYHTCLAVYQK